MIYETAPSKVDSRRLRRQEILTLRLLGGVCAVLLGVDRASVTSAAICVVEGFDAVRQ